MTNWLLEYPRSGGNWVQYIVRTITGIELQKTHLYQNDQRISEADTVVFMLRNYKESIIRHTNFRSIEQLKTVLTGKAVTKEPDYIYSLDFFDKFKGKKIIVYYEDLIKRNYAQIQRICGFLKHTEGIQLFLNSIKDHIQLSIDEMAIKGERSETKAYNFKIDYHSRMYMTAASRILIDKFVRENFEYLYFKYLDRYESTTL